MPIRTTDIPSGMFGTLVESVTRPLYHYHRPPPYWSEERKREERDRIAKDWAQRNSEWESWRRDQREKYGYANPDEVGL